MIFLLEAKLGGDEPPNSSTWAVEARGSIKDHSHLYSELRQAWATRPFLITPSLLKKRKRKRKLSLRVDARLVVEH